MGAAEHEVAEEVRGLVYPCPREACAGTAKVTRLPESAKAS